MPLDTLLRQTFVLTGPAADEPEGTVAAIEYAEDLYDLLVDVEGDVDYRRSRSFAFDPQGNLRPEEELQYLGWVAKEEGMKRP